MCANWGLWVYLHKNTHHMNSTWNGSMVIDVVWNGHAEVIPRRKSGIRHYWLLDFSWEWRTHRPFPFVMDGGKWRFYIQELWQLCVVCLQVQSGPGAGSESNCGVAGWEWVWQEEVTTHQQEEDILALLTCWPEVHSRCSHASRRFIPHCWSVARLLAMPHEAHFWCWCVSILWTHVLFIQNQSNPNGWLRSGWDPSSTEPHP